MRRPSFVMAFAVALFVAFIAKPTPSLSVAATGDAAFKIPARAAPELPLAPEVRSVHGLAYLKLTAAIDPSTKLPAFYFAGNTVAPTIRVRPGDTIVIDYSNRLASSNAMRMDMSNLHTHGLMDSPKAPGDQVIMTMIMPGQTYRYVFAIPQDQPPGLYWYHPHPHGESNYQVASGMSGLIIIDGIETYAPIVRGLPERDIILRDYYFDPSVAPLARFRQRAVMHEVARQRAANPALDLGATTRAVAARAQSLPPTAPSCNVADASKGATINGLPSATITMRPGTRQFFRIANASANSFFDLNIPGAHWLVVANDGVPLSFHDRSVQGQWLDHVVLPPGGRVEAVVAAPHTATTLWSGCIDYGPDGDTDPTRPLATIALGGDAAVDRMNAAALPASAEPFGNIRTVHIAARRIVNFSENNPDGMFYINGQMWDPNAPPMFTVHAGTVEEWTVANYADELHAFHIHQIHFLVEDINGVAQPPSTWRDTITLPYAKHNNRGVRPSVVHLLMDFRDPIIVGTFVFHCHILEHEDYGMMAKIRVVGPGAPLLNARNFREGFINTK